MTRLSVSSFAKINWTLKVLGKRSDGYHQISTIFQTVDLSEKVVFEETPHPAIRLEVRGRTVARGEDNLLYRTADLLKKMAGSHKGVQISLEKEIPVGAGLGGGASNAAVALLALNQLWDCQLGETQLVELATQLGSDVPFFLVGGTAFGSGRGAEVVPLPDTLGPQSLIALYPHLEISTREAYALGNWGRYSGTQALTEELVETTMQDLLRAVDRRGESWSFLENDFEEVLFDHYPVLVEARKALRKAGCQRVMLCGSGSTLLGFGSENQVKEAAVALSQKGIGEILLCRILSREKYKQALVKEGLFVS